jgi:hypothetical protein
MGAEAEELALLSPEFSTQDTLGRLFHGVHVLASTPARLSCSIVKRTFSVC